MQSDVPMPQVLIASQLVTPQQVIRDAAVVIEKGKIAAVGHKDEIDILDTWDVLDLDDKTIAPGLIDVHIHGFAGVEIGQSVADVLHIAEAIARNGTTAFLPTVSFAPTLDGILEMLETTATAITSAVANTSAAGGAEMLGIHMEGPFLSKAGKGQWDRYPPAGYLAGSMARDPSVDELRLMAQAAGGQIKIMSIAPELDGALAVIEDMCHLGIVPSAAHTTASYEQVVTAIEVGLKSATHLYNGMRRQDHREPGVIEAVLSRDELVAEIIGDCVHVHPPAIDIAVRCKGADRIVLVTDNTRFAGLPNGVYKDDLGRDIVKDDKKAHVPGWTLAGSVSPLNRNVRNMITHVGCSLPQAVRMASLNPARLIGVADRKGSLEVGKDADLIVIDEHINVHATMVNGDWVHATGEIEAR